MMLGHHRGVIRRRAEALGLPLRRQVWHRQTMTSKPVVLRPLGEDDGGGWVAIVPDLPGCMADGETAFEALSRAEDAISEWKDAARSMGRSIPIALDEP